MIPFCRYFPVLLLSLLLIACHQTDDPELMASGNID